MDPKVTRASMSSKITAVVITSDRYLIIDRYLICQRRVVSSVLTTIDNMGTLQRSVSVSLADAANN
jgi:hypothetical protein